MSLCCDSRGPACLLLLPEQINRGSNKKTKLTTTNTETLQVQTIHLPLCVYVDGCVYVFLMLPNIALYSNCPYHDNFPPNSTVYSSPGPLPTRRKPNKNGNGPGRKSLPRSAIARSLSFSFALSLSRSLRTPGENRMRTPFGD